ncbi:unnamed protein product [Thlaspi arvense]|uniref:Uncharacterized protein n=1 Tax=Thlaspi arvense TaxID=13288 RepID=A0AAU9RWU7_THLAR|nr:unnamed protein product [Thlaspi arvense]
MQITCFLNKVHSLLIRICNDFEDEDIRERNYQRYNVEDLYFNPNERLWRFDFVCSVSKAEFTIYSSDTQCCNNLKMDKMYCLCEAVIPTFGQNFDFFKLGQLFHACGDVKPPGSYCGVYKIPGGA